MEHNRFNLSKIIYITLLLSLGLFSIYAWSSSIQNKNIITSLQQDVKNTLVKDSLNTKEKFRFAAVGDFDYNDNTRSVLDIISKSKTNFSLGLGDLSYDKTPTEAIWCDLITSKLGNSYAFQLVAGNHDVGENGNKASIDRFASCLPNRMTEAEGVYAQQYFFDYNNLARFITFSPDLTINGREYSYTQGSTGQEWLLQTIDNARSKKLKWIIVAMHKNCLTIGQKSCEISPEVLNLLTNKKVDLILQGHEHGYIRSHQLTLNDECKTLSPGEFKSNCIIKSDKNIYKKDAGPILAIVGTGGAEIRPINLNSPDLGYFADYSGSNTDPSYGPLIVDVNSNSISATFTGTDNKLHDSFVIK